MSSQSDSFVSLAVAGEVPTDAIDDYVDQWHQNPAGQPLHEYLGMTRDEYALWISAPDTLPLIVASRRLDTPLSVLAHDSIQSMRVAAHAGDALKLRRLEAWLRDRNLV